MEISDHKKKKGMDYTTRLFVQPEGLKGMEEVSSAMVKMEMHSYVPLSVQWYEPIQ